MEVVGLKLLDLLAVLTAASKDPVGRGDPTVLHALRTTQGLEGTNVGENMATPDYDSAHVAGQNGTWKQAMPPADLSSDSYPSGSSSSSRGDGFSTSRRK